MPGALIVAAWLVEAKQNVVENIAPVLTRVFTPLTIVMLLVFLGVFATTGGLHRRRPRAAHPHGHGARARAVPAALLDLRPRPARAARPVRLSLQLVLVVAALAVDAVTLTAMLTRIAEFGFSANKVAALGLNLVLLVHLVRSAWLSVGFLRGRTPVRPDRTVADALPPGLRRVGADRGRGLPARLRVRVAGPCMIGA